MSPTAKGTALLQGLRVVQLADPPAAHCGRLLTDLGAEVILVEPIGGAPRRRFPPFKAGQADAEGSLSFAYFHRGQAGITLNLATQDGRAVLHRLLDRVDVLLEGGPPAERERGGLGYSALDARHPRLVLASITPFGQTGPYRDFRASDAVAFAMGGLMHVSGRPNRAPVVAPGEQAQVVAGAHAVMGILTALRSRDRTGRGQHVDVAMQAALAAQENLISSAAGEGHPARRTGSQHRVATPGRVYPCKDGYVHFFVSPAQIGSWERLMEWMGHPEEFAAPEWQHAAYRRAHAAVVDQVVIRWAARFSRRELYEEGQRRKIPCVPVNTLADFVNDPQVQARGFVQEADHPVFGRFRYPGSPWLVDGERPTSSAPPPQLGQHNRALYLGELGIEEARYERLYALGVI